MSLTKVTYSMIENAAIDVTNFGAVGDGVTDDTAAIDNAKAALGNSGSLYIPHGNYLYSGTVYAITADFIWNNQNYSKSSGVNLMQQARSNCLLLTSETPNTTPINSADSRVAINVTIDAKGAQHADGIRSNLFNYSTDGQGNTGFYGYAASDTTANWSASLHGETFAAGGTNIGVNTESASFAAGVALYGAVISNTTSQFIGGSGHPITGNPPIAATNAVGILVAGTALTNEMGGWATGLKFNTDSLRTGGIGILFAQSKHLDSLIRSYTGGICSTADIYLEANSNIGILLGGTYTSSAIRINAGQYISLEQTAAQKILSGTGSPQGVVTAAIGSLYCRLDGGANTTLYVKESGTGNTGWVAK